MVHDLRQTCLKLGVGHVAVVQRRSKADHPVLRGVDALDHCLWIEKALDLHSHVLQPKPVEAGTEISCNVLEAGRVADFVGDASRFTAQLCRAGNLSLGLCVVDLRAQCINIRLAVAGPTKHGLEGLREAAFQATNLRAIWCGCFARSALLGCKLCALGICAGCSCRLHSRRWFCVRPRRYLPHEGSEAVHFPFCSNKIAALGDGVLAGFAFRSFARLFYAADLLTKASYLCRCSCIFLLYICQLPLDDRGFSAGYDECRSKLIRKAGLAIFTLTAGTLQQSTARCLSEDILHHRVAHRLTLRFLQRLADLWEVHLPSLNKLVENGVKLALSKASVLYRSKRIRRWRLPLSLTRCSSRSKNCLNFREGCIRVDLAAISDAASFAGCPDCLSLHKGKAPQAHRLSIATLLAGVATESATPPSLTLRGNLCFCGCNCTFINLSGLKGRGSRRSHLRIGLRFLRCAKNVSL